jgi:hypothetical protein
LPLECGRVVIALIENYSTSNPLEVSTEKSRILSCDTVVANERYIYIYKKHIPNTVQFPNLETCRVRKRGKTKEKGGTGYEAITCFMA